MKWTIQQSFDWRETHFYYRKSFEKLIYKGFISDFFFSMVSVSDASLPVAIVIGVDVSVSTVQNHHNRQWHLHGLWLVARTGRTLPIVRACQYRWASIKVYISRNEIHFQISRSNVGLLTGDVSFSNFTTYSFPCDIFTERCDQIF